MAAPRSTDNKRAATASGLDERDGPPAKRIRLDETPSSSLTRRRAHTATRPTPPHEPTEYDSTSQSSLSSPAPSSSSSHSSESDELNKRSEEKRSSLLQSLMVELSQDLVQSQNDVQHYKDKLQKIKDKNKQLRRNPEKEKALI